MINCEPAPPTKLLAKKVAFLPSASPTVIFLPAARSAVPTLTSAPFVNAAPVVKVNFLAAAKEPPFTVKAPITNESSSKVT